MKKFYAFVAAALMSVSLFAAAPTAADLAKEYDVVNNVVLCIQFIEDAAVCTGEGTGIFFVGTPNNWAKGDGDAESFDNCEKFMPVPGFEGWYAAELPYSADFQGKPVQRQAGATDFSWDYQCGDVDAWEWVDGLTMNITAGFADECNIAMASAGAYIYKLKYWKKHNKPCEAAVLHDYEIILYAPDACGTKPGIVGDFNKWKANAEMSEDMDEEFNDIWTIKFTDAEGHGFKIVEYGETVDWSTQIWHYNVDADKWEEGKNVELGSETKIILDWSDNDLHRFNNCKPAEDKFQVLISFVAPAGAPEAVEVVGTFDGWNGTPMELQDGKWIALVEAAESDEFKFRSGIGETADEKWANQIMVFNGEKWDNAGNMSFSIWEEGTGEMAGLMLIAVDFSDAAKYCWTASKPQGIQNVTLTEKAHKVVVDGVIYIVRDNKMFNLQGAQVR